MIYKRKPERKRKMLQKLLINNIIKIITKQFKLDKNDERLSKLEKRVAKLEKPT